MARKKTPRKPARRVHKKTRKAPLRKVTKASKADGIAKGGVPAKQDPKEGPPPAAFIPFDARFFQRQFPHLLPRKHKKSATHAPDYVVNVILGDGSVALDISHIEELGDEWALFGVYDTNGFHPHEGPVRYVFVPYASIARVEVTGAESRIRAIGFAVRRLDALKKRKKKTARRKAKAASAGRKKPARKTKTARRTRS